MLPYYSKNGIVIYCGDCLEIMPCIDLQFDSIFSDLPYGVTGCKWDSVIPLDLVWVEYKRLIKDSGAIILSADEPFSSALGASNLEWLKYKWIWVKNRPSDKFNAKNKPMDIFEDIFIFSPGNIANGSSNKMTYNPQGITSINKIVRGRTGERHYGTRPLSSRKKRYIATQSNYPVNILYFPRDEPLIHPTQKPVALMSYLINTYTNYGEIILDNAMGVGTTLIAALTEGRQAVGREISEDYCKVAKEQLQQPSFFSIPMDGNVATKIKQSSIWSRKV